MNDQENNLQQEQIQMTRNGLLLNACNKYHELIALLKRLPIPQSSPEINHAYLEMAGAMLWIKEIIMSAPLTYAAPEPLPACAPIEPQTKDEVQC